MPAKDKYHDAVINALKKDGWQIVQENLTIGDEVRRIIVDILAICDDTQAILVEIKVFECMKSPMNYLQRAIGQYMIYKAMLDYAERSISLYLALPNEAYQDFFAEEFVAHAVKYLGIKMIVYEPETEEIVLWIH